ncbi:copper homeostasis cutC homolog isoform X1 [Pelobates cultripes]|uniref:Copper homeostasis protein cutC homolog n=1 Tax=Pelobates cultripes TaxID=61616 RepID=A0AAD1T9Y9_PELCU|nr:copper homeostasis cutC homolog isoform X1 [Pelobates cultripes]
MSGRCVECFSLRERMWDGEYRREMADQGFLMEVCVDSVESAVNAERGGAGRIELCGSLLEGGITPSMGLLQVVKQYVQIPVFVMIRPRGGDFLYSDREAEVMKADIRLAKMHNADGLVFGALTEDGRIDAELCMDLLALSRPLPVTFHRAFDMVYDPMLAMETLISLGFERVLTSGCDSSALEGLPLIKRLVEQAKGRILVMPGNKTSFFLFFLFNERLFYVKKIKCPYVYCLVRLFAVADRPLQQAVV